MRLNFLTGIQCCGSTIGIHSFNCGFVQTWVQKCYNGAEKPEAVIIGSRVGSQGTQCSEVLVK